MPTVSFLATVGDPRLKGGNCSAPEVHLLGEIVVAFGNLEFFLEATICHLLTADDNQERFQMVQAMTTEMSFGRKVHALGSMFRQKEIANAEPELSGLIKELFDAEIERNQLLHSVWSIDSPFGEGSFMRTKASAKAAKGLRRGFHKMPAERIEATLKQIEAAGQSLANFTVKYIQVPEPKAVKFIQAPELKIE
jgi:hypothetical protein